MTQMLDFGGRTVTLDRPLIMGILNVTPDSFSDGGRFNVPIAALDHARRMVDQGAAFIDVGGESTRPGADEVPVQEELDRVIPVIEMLVAELPVVVSVDSCKPEVMRASAAAGAGMINDVCALRREGALEAAAETGLPVCLMHMQGTPRTMQQHPRYSNLVEEIASFFGERIACCERAGIARDRLLLDPGFGFGKSLEHNYELLARIGEFRRFQLPLLVGISRKSMIGLALGGAPVEQRMVASVAAALLAAERGAQILRVHDVAETCDALAVLRHLRDWRDPASGGL